MKAQLLLICFFVISTCFCQSVEDNKQTLLNSQKSIDSLTRESSRLTSENNITFAIINLNKALKIATSLNDLERISVIHNRLGINFMKIKDYESAEAFFLKSYQVSEAGNFLRNKSVSALNLSMCFIKQEKFEAAKKYAEIVMNLPKDEGNINAKLLNSINVIEVYLALNEYIKAEDIINQLNKEKVGLEKFGLTNAYTHALAIYYNHIGNSDKASFYYDQLLSANNKSGFTFAGDMLLEYSNFLYDQGQFEDAYVNLLKYTTSADSVTTYENKRLAKSINLLENAFLSDEEISNIKATNDAVEVALKRHKLFLYIIAAFFIMSMILSIFLWKNYTRLKSLNKQLKLKNKELKLAKQQTIELSNIRTKFINTITHELRTPLYGIIGLTDILMEKNQAEENGIHLQSLSFSAKYLLSLINDVLYINKIEEQDKIILDKKSFSIENEINLIYEVLKPIGTKNNNQFVSHLDNKIPGNIITDKTRLTQIFMNLLSNAMKFTHNGKVSFSAELVSRQNNMLSIKFTIADNGIGISKENQELVFEKFVQIDRKEDDYLGSGLGLSIVSKLIKQLDSEITMESELGKGTIFSFILSCEEDIVSNSDDINSENDIELNQSLNILVVEDNKINQLVTKNILRREQLDCTVVDNGYSAIEAVKKQYFNLILMDLNMPEINGFETSKLIRKFNLNIPIIALTAFSKEEVSKEIIESGIDDIITKPFESKKLITIIKRMFPNRGPIDVRA